jgi:ATP-dependent Clp protease adaptor protein ClpS
MKKEVYKEETTTLDQVANKRELVLINDDYHTFDYVIDALVDICSHTYEQATQCAMITHYKGECEVKNGYLHELRPLRKALTDRQLRAKIN